MSARPRGHFLVLLNFLALGHVVGPPFSGVAQSEGSCAAVFEMPAASADEPVNLGQMKAQLEVYHGCQYERAVAKVLGDAEAYVAVRAAAVAKPAVVLDIDDTALSNWPMLVRNDLGLIRNGDCPVEPTTACGFTAWKLRAQAEVIAPTLALFKAAVANNVPVFFITGRIEGAALRAATVDNLTRAGYAGWEELVLRSPDPGCDVTCFKRQERAAIEQRGYTIIANVGDQWSDLDPDADRKSGTHAERIFKVPNPFYFIR